MSPQSYLRAKSEQEEEESEFLINETNFAKPIKSPSVFQRLSAWGWCSATILLSILYVRLLLKTMHRSTYESGFLTDLEPVRGSFQLEKVQFTGALKVVNGKLLRMVNSGEPQYVGPPSDAVDQSWADMMQGLEIVLGGNEAKTVAGKTVQEPNKTEWRLSLDVYHSLHCVDLVRRALDMDYYYGPGTNAVYDREHVDHCLDYIRQDIQCHSDLTPLSYLWDEEAQGVLPVFNSTHTCRKFSDVHLWALQRSGANTTWIGRDGERNDRRKKMLFI